MAQLVKLYDHISRYETDIFRYPSRFVRLKKERWDKLLSDWTNQQKGTFFQNNIFAEMDSEKEKGLLRDKLKNMVFKKRNNGLQKDINEPFMHHVNKEQERLQLIKNKEQLVSAYKDEIFHFQINWASSTLSEKSTVKRKYYYDPLLAYYVKELPDSYFIFYEPVIYLKKAPVDFDTIVLTPSEIWLIVSLRGTEDTIYQNFSDKYWMKSHRGVEEKLLHPNISIKRMRSVIEHILMDNHLSFPIKTAIIAKDSYIDIPPAQQRIKLIDRRNFLEWHRSMLRNVAPIKHHQLKIAHTLLSNSLTIASIRDTNNEWL